jgi:hypothetical protein
MGWLIPVGVLLILLGVGGSMAACYDFSGGDQVTQGPDGGVPAQAAESDMASLLLAPLSGLALALGVGCIGVGMGRWRRPEPSDVRTANPFNEQPGEKGEPPVGLV